MWTASLVDVCTVDLPYFRHRSIVPQKVLPRQPWAAVSWAILIASLFEAIASLTLVKRCHYPLCPRACLPACLPTWVRRPSPPVLDSKGLESPYPHPPMHMGPNSALGHPHRAATPYPAEPRPVLAPAPTYSSRPALPVWEIGPGTGLPSSKLRPLCCRTPSGACPRNRSPGSGLPHSG